MRPIDLLALHIVLDTIAFGTVAVVAILHDHWWMALCIVLTYAIFGAGSSVRWEGALGEPR